MTRSIYSLNDIFDLMSHDFQRAFDQIQETQVFGNGFPPYNAHVHKETKDLLFEFALAGYDKKDVEISFDGDYMFLELNSPNRERMADFATINQGIKQSKTKLKVAVPSSRYEQQNAKAAFEQGILSVFVPRKEEQKPRKIEISIERKNLLT